MTSDENAYASNQFVIIACYNLNHNLYFVLLQIQHNLFHLFERSILIMKSKPIILSALLVFSTLISCENGIIDTAEEEIVVEAITIMPNGCWIEMEDEAIFQFAGTNHTFCFLNSTEFTLELESWTDALIDLNDPGRWTEHIKGEYIWTNESLEVSGSYFDSEYTNSTTSKYGETEFIRAFEVKVISETEIILDNNEDNPYLEIRLLN